MVMSIVLEVRDAIAAANKNFMSTFNQGDAAGLAALYTDNGQVLPPNGDFVIGKEAIQTFWQAVMDMGVKSVKMDILEVESCEDTAVEMSTFELYGEGDQLIDKGKYIVIWKQEAGQWKLHRDIFNSSQPPPG